MRRNPRRRDIGGATSFGVFFLLALSFITGFGFQCAHGFLYLLETALSPVQFLGQIPSFLALAVTGVFLGICHFRSDQKLLDLPLKFLFGLLHSTVAHGLVLRSVGSHLRSIEGDVAKAHQTGLLTQA